MTDPDQNTWFANAVTSLKGDQDMPVWSLLVAFFSDMATAPGAQVSSAALTRVLTPLGIKPEAQRVALHRLRKEGWLDSQRLGRGSTHGLTATGHRALGPTFGRLSQRAPTPTRDWYMLVAGSVEGLEALNALEAPGSTQPFVRLNRHAGLSTVYPTDKGAELLCSASLPETASPNWLKETLFPQDLSEACDLLLADLSRLTDIPLDLSAVERACLRSALLLRWDSILSQHGALEPSFHPAYWRGEACREEVFAVLDTLPRPSLTDLENER